MGEEISFDIDPRILDAISQEFAVEKLVDDFAKSIASKKGREIEDIEKNVFGEYGRKLMAKAMELGEKYPDRTYEVIKEVEEKTGVGLFPHVSQRFLEIFNMGTQHDVLKIVVTNPSQLTHMVGPCVFLNAIEKKCGEDVAKLLTCKHVDLLALETLYANLNVPVIVRMETSIPSEGYCQFTVLRKV